MQEFIESIKKILNGWGELAEVILNGLSLISIAIGIVMSLIRSIEERRRRPGDHPLHSNFRLWFGGWLVVALEFQLAADIVGTIISPTTEHLIELGSIALIRTFLNYFLNKELREEKEIVEANRERLRIEKYKPLA